MSESSVAKTKITPVDVGTLVARLVVGGIFVLYSFGKIAEPTVFLKGIREYQIFPDQPALLINLTAVLLPWLELIAGLALVTGLLRRGAGATLTVMLIVFTVAIFVRALGVQANEGTAFCDIIFDCGCGSGEVVVCTKLAKNVGLIILGLFCTFSSSGRFTLAGMFTPSTASTQQPSGAS